MRLRPRATHTIKVPRPFESYLDGYYEQRLSSNRSILPPDSRHVLMAGCTRFGQAFESDDNRGIFSKTLMEALDRTGPNVSYSDLFLRVRSLVRKNAFGQTPQFEVFGGFNSNEQFLNPMSVAGRKRCSVHYMDWDGWYLEQGAIHGLSLDAETPVEVQLFEDEVSTEPIGRGTSTAVGLNESRMQLHGFEPDKKKVYTAEITSIQQPQMTVYLRGDKDAAKALQQHIDISTTVARNFDWDEESPKGLKYEVVAEPNVFEVRRLDVDKLIQRVEGVSRAACEYVADKLLNKIAKWDHGLHLTNPASQSDPNVVKFAYSRLNPDKTKTEFTDEDVTFEIVNKNGVWSSVNGEIIGRNMSTQRLYFMLVWFREDFKIHVFNYGPHEPGEDEFRFQLDVDGRTFENMGFGARR